MPAKLPEEPGKAKGSKSAGERPIKPREALFVAKYTDPLSSSFSDAKASAKVVGYGTTPSTHGSTGSRISRKPQIQSRIQRNIEAMDVDHKVRARVLSDIVHGDVPHETTITTVSPDGSEKTQVITRQTPIKDRLQAIHILNKMDGTYAQADAAVDVQRKILERELSEIGDALGG